jgi:cell wall-associated NlpC family hydrolase
MPRYSAEQIYGFARQAGFSPDAAATMTAVALAESGGNSRAHNPHGENSQGLWQINGQSHPDLLGQLDLYDPVQNAKAAFLVSHQGADISPWTVTHGGAGARYLRYRDTAQAAAVSFGEGADRGVWTGTPGYGHAVSAGPGMSGGGLAAQFAAPSAGFGPGVGGFGATTPGFAATAPGLVGTPAAGGSNPALEHFLDVAKAQIGDRYVFGAEVKLDDANPNTWDCSEFTQWAAHQAGSDIPDGATAQYLKLKKDNKVISVEDAKNTPGALLFSFDREPQAGDGRTPGAHVAISLGNGRIVEAANPRVGVRESSAGNRFQYAAVVPGISDGTATPLQSADLGMQSFAGIAIGEPAPGTMPPPDLGGPDTDHDGLSDALERRYGLDPNRADTDGDHLNDAYEMTTSHTDGRLADSDGDRLDDAFELAQGLNPLAPDSDEDGHLDGSLPADQIDTDGDGLDDALENALHLNAQLADSDADGFSDALEAHSHSSALDAHDTPLSHHLGADPAAAHLPLSPVGADPAVDLLGH